MFDHLYFAHVRRFWIEPRPSFRPALAKQVPALVQILFDLTPSRSLGFIEAIHPRWAKVAAFGDDREALLLYDLTLRSGSPMRIADYYTLDNGKIQTEMILWDTYGSPFRQQQVERDQS